MKKRIKQFVAFLMMVALVLPVLNVVAAETTSDISWFAGQNGNPWSGSNFTFEYVDATQNTLAITKMETYNSGWQDTTGTAKIGTWKQWATNEKYAVTAFNVPTAGKVTIGDKDNKVNAVLGDGQLMFVQKSGSEYAALTEWIDIKNNSTISLTDVSTYAKAGDVVYSVYRGVTGETAVENYCPKVVYDSGVEDAGNLYPTDWTILKTVFNGEEQQIETTTSDIGWFAGQNGNPWSGSNYTFEYVDVEKTELAFTKMETYNAGWQDTTGTAKLSTWKQWATNAKYAAVAFNVPEDGKITIGDKDLRVNAVEGDGQLIFVQKSSSGYAALTDWIDVKQGTTIDLANVVTYAKAGDVVYSVYRGTAGSSALENYCTTVTYDKYAKDTQNLYPTEWLTLRETFFGKEPAVEIISSHIEWFASANGNPWSGSNYTFEYVDASQTELSFTKMEVFDANHWKDSTGSAVIRTWKQEAQNYKYAAVAFNVPEDGKVTIGDKDKTVNGVSDENGQIIFVQKSNGQYHALTEWIDIKTGATVTLSDVSTYAKKGDAIYSVYRSVTNKSAAAESLCTAVTYEKYAKDTGNLYPTEWDTLTNVLGGGQSGTPEPAPLPVTEWTNHIEWFVQQWVQPWEASYFTFEYFDTEKNAFHEFEAWNNLGAPAFWQDATGVANVKPWEMVATGSKYAATVVNVDTSGTLLLTKTDAAVTGGLSTGEFMILQSSKNAEGDEVFHALKDWTKVEAGQTMEWQDVKTYAHKGDKIYYLYRATSYDSASLQIAPKITYMLNAEESDEYAYPTTWGSIADVLKVVHHEMPTYEIKTIAGEGGDIKIVSGNNVAGSDITYEFLPKEGFEIADVIVDGKSIGKTSRYTFAELRGKHVLEVKFKASKKE